jgi:hypothetical protein
MNDEEFDDLARAIDARIQQLGEGCDPARLFGVRLRENGFVLVPFWSGVAREIPFGIAPPDECVAIALDTGGWAAPMNDDGTVDSRPSQHPLRQRVRHTALVYGAGVDVSVLTYQDDEPQVLRDGVGVVVELMRACWSRRRFETPGGAI